MLNDTQQRNCFCKVPGYFAGWCWLGASSFRAARRRSSQLRFIIIIWFAGETHIESAQHLAAGWIMVSQGFLFTDDSSSEVVDFSLLNF